MIIIEPETNSVVITLKRHETDGPYPVYNLTVFENGVVKYEGIKNVKVTGIEVSKIPEKEVKELIDEFINIYYFALKDRYAKDKSTGQQQAVTTSIFLDKKTKTIYNDHCSAAPQALYLLEDKIDNITDSKRWTG
jgi:hypothetical protein